MTDGDPDKPLEYLQQLDEEGRQVFYHAVDTIYDHVIVRGQSPDRCYLGKIDNRSDDVTCYVWRCFFSRKDETAVHAFVNYVQSLKTLGLGSGSAPSGQVGGPEQQAVSTSDAPLMGRLLGDGQALSWEERLKEPGQAFIDDVASNNDNNSNNSNSTSTPILITNYVDACQIRAEYASLNFKEVPATATGDFPTDADEQCCLVRRLYAAILNMDNILEHRQTTARKAGPMTAGSKRKRTDGDDVDADDDNDNEVDNEGEIKEHGSDKERRMLEPATRLPGIKQPISVTKVKGLSRIEATLLCWEILYTIKDVHQGRVPFMRWSGRDWSWDAGFSSFMERFEAVATTLHSSKAAVCSLLESDYLARLAAHPRRELRRKENNRSQNAERNAQVRVGRHAIGAGHVSVDNSTGDLRDRDGNLVASAAMDHSGIIEQTQKLRRIAQSGGRGRAGKAAGAVGEAGGAGGGGTGEDKATAAVARNNDNGKSRQTQNSQERRKRIKTDGAAKSSTTAVATATATTAITASTQTGAQANAQTYLSQTLLPMPLPLAMANPFVDPVLAGKGEGEGESENNNNNNKTGDVDEQRLNPQVQMSGDEQEWEANTSEFNNDTLLMSEAGRDTDVSSMTCESSMCMIAAGDVNADADQAQAQTQTQEYTDFLWTDMVANDDIDSDVASINRLRMAFNNSPTIAPAAETDDSLALAQEEPSATSMFNSDPMLSLLYNIDNEPGGGYYFDGATVDPRALSASPRPRSPPPLQQQHQQQQEQQEEVNSGLEQNCGPETLLQNDQVFFGEAARKWMTNLKLTRPPQLPRQGAKKAGH